MKLIDKIGNFFKPKIDAEGVTKIIENVIRKTISWDKLFLTGKDINNFGNKVDKPYRNIASVYKAVKAISDNIPQADIKIYSKATGKEVDDDRLLTLLNNPNKEQSGNDFIQEWVGFYALYGEGFILPLASLGQAVGNVRLPAELRNLDPEEMQEIIDYTQGILTGWRYGKTSFVKDMVIHTKDFNPYNRFRGLSPLTPIEDEMKIDEATLSFNKDFFSNDATPNLFLTTEKVLTPEQRTSIIAQLEERHKGEGNKHKAGILYGGLKPEVVSPSHKEMEFIEQKRLTREEILGIWRTPKALFNITEDLNYATFMGQMRIFWIYTLMPIMRKFEDSINKHIIEPYNSGLYFGFDYSNVPAFQADLGEKVTMAKTLFDMGFTADEINAMLRLGFDPADWRKEWWIGFGQVPARVALEEANNPPEPLPEEVLPPNNEKPEEEPKVEEPAKAVKTISRDARQQAIIKGFLKRQGSLERVFEGKLGKYMLSIRKAVLATPTEKLAEGHISIDWQKFDKELKGIAEPILLEAIKQGVEQGKDVLGKKTIVEDMLSNRIGSYWTIRANKIVQVNTTIKNKIGNAVTQAIEAGQTELQTGQSIIALGDNVREALKGVFNSIGTRAKLIARTETSTAVNGGSQLFYELEGVPKKIWLTSNDEFVRESHRNCEEQGAIGIDSNFVNGLRFPSDQEQGDASECCNCRCVLAPIVME